LRKASLLLPASREGVNTLGCAADVL